METGPVTMANPPPPPVRPMMGDYRLTTNRCRLTHFFQPDNPLDSDIKTFAQQGLNENQYEGRDTQCPYEHLSKFYETCQYCVPPANVSEDQKNLGCLPLLWAEEPRIDYCPYLVKPYKLGKI